MTSRPRPDLGPHPRGVTGSLSARLALVLIVVLAQFLACQALGGSQPAPTSVAQDVQHGSGHDLVCEAAIATTATAAAGCRAQVPDPLPASLVATILAVLVLAALQGTRHGPVSAPARPLHGRERLLAADILRI